jgi:hypothetical protein
MMKDYIDVTKLNDVVRRQYTSPSWLATILFPAAMPTFKGDQKISRNSAIFEHIFDIFSPCPSE